MYGGMFMETGSAEQLFDAAAASVHARPAAERSRASTQRARAQAAADRGHAARHAERRRARARSAALRATRSSSRGRRCRRSRDRARPPRRVLQPGARGRVGARARRRARRERERARWSRSRTSRSGSRSRAGSCSTATSATSRRSTASRSTIRARRDARPRRRVRLRQVDGRPRDAAALRADRRAGSSSTARTSRTLGEDELRPLRRRMQMVFQDPFASLNPRHSVGRIVGEPLRVHGLASRRRVAGSACASCSRSSACPPTRRRATRTSSRAASASASASRARSRVNPDFIVADEPVSALDVSIQAQIINLLEELQERVRPDVPVHRPRPRRRPAHLRPDRRHVPRLDRRGLAGGRALRRTRCTRTRSRCSRRCRSRIPMVERQRETILLPGDLPSPANPPAGCRFHTRCPYVQPTRCRDEVPPLRALAAGTRSPATGRRRSEQGRSSRGSGSRSSTPGRPSRSRCRRPT